jgi:hypothetical protein
VHPAVPCGLWFSRALNQSFLRQIRKMPPISI